MTWQAPEASAGDLDSAYHATVREDCNAFPERGIAGHRAESDLASLARNELASTLATGVCRTWQAHLLCRPRLESLSTTFTCAEQPAIWKTSSHRSDKMSGLLPHRIVDLGVAGSAECREIVNRVCRFVVSEQAKRPDVVDGQSFSSTAKYALVSVAVHGEATLCCPARTTVAAVTSTPRWIECSGESTPWNAHAKTIALSGGIVECW
jgi:hypothetical protein